MFPRSAATGGSGSGGGGAPPFPISPYPTYGTSFISPAGVFHKPAPGGTQKPRPPSKPLPAYMRNTSASSSHVTERHKPQDYQTTLDEETTAMQTWKNIYEDPSTAASSIPSTKPSSTTHTRPQSGVSRTSRNSSRPNSSYLRTVVPNPPSGTNVPVYDSARAIDLYSSYQPWYRGGSAARVSRPTSGTGLRLSSKRSSMESKESHSEDTPQSQQPIQQQQQQQPSNDRAWLLSQGLLGSTNGGSRSVTAAATDRDEYLSPKARAAREQQQKEAQVLAKVTRQGVVTMQSQSAASTANQETTADFADSSSATAPTAAASSADSHQTEEKTSSSSSVTINSSSFTSTQFVPVPLAAADLPSNNLEDLSFRALLLNQQVVTGGAPLAYYSFIPAPMKAIPTLPLPPASRSSSRPQSRPQSGTRMRPSTSRPSSALRMTPQQPLNLHAGSQTSRPTSAFRPTVAIALTPAQHQSSQFSAQSASKPKGAHPHINYAASMYRAAATTPNNNTAQQQFIPMSHRKGPLGYESPSLQKAPPSRGGRRRTNKSLDDEFQLEELLGPEASIIAASDQVRIEAHKSQTHDWAAYEERKRRWTYGLPSEAEEEAARKKEEDEKNAEMNEDMKLKRQIESQERVEAEIREFRAKLASFHRAISTPSSPEQPLRSMQSATPSQLQTQQVQEAVPRGLMSPGQHKKLEMHRQQFEVDRDASSRPTSSATFQATQTAFLSPSKVMLLDSLDEEDRPRNWTAEQREQVEALSVATVSQLMSPYTNRSPAKHDGSAEKTSSRRTDNNDVLDFISTDPASFDPHPHSSLPGSHLSTSIDAAMSRVDDVTIIQSLWRRKLAKKDVAIRKEMKAKLEHERRAAQEENQFFEQFIRGDGKASVVKDVPNTQEEEEGQNQLESLPEDEEEQKKKSGGGLSLSISDDPPSDPFQGVLRSPRAEANSAVRAQAIESAMIEKLGEMEAAIAATESTLKRYGSQRSIGKTASTASLRNSQEPASPIMGRIPSEKRIALVTRAVSTPSKMSSPTASRRKRFGANQATPTHANRRVYEITSNPMSSSAKLRADLKASLQSQALVIREMLRTNAAKEALQARHREFQQTQQRMVQHQAFVASVMSQGGMNGSNGAQRGAVRGSFDASASQILGFDELDELTELNMDQIRNGITEASANTGFDQDTPSADMLPPPTEDNMFLQDENRALVTYRNTLLEHGLNIDGSGDAMRPEKLQGELATRLATWLTSTGTHLSAGSDGNPSAQALREMMLVSGASERAGEPPLEPLPVTEEDLALKATEEKNDALLSSALVEVKRSVVEEETQRIRDCALEVEQWLADEDALTLVQSLARGRVARGKVDKIREELIQSREVREARALLLAKQRAEEAANSEAAKAELSRLESVRATRAAADEQEQLSIQRAQDADVGLILATGDELRTKEQIMLQQQAREAARMEQQQEGAPMRISIATADGQQILFETPLSPSRSLQSKMFFQQEQEADLLDPASLLCDACGEHKAFLFCDECGSQKFCIACDENIHVDTEAVLAEDGTEVQPAQFMSHHERRAYAAPGSRAAQLAAAKPDVFHLEPLSAETYQHLRELLQNSGILVGEDGQAHVEHIDTMELDAMIWLCGGSAGTIAYLHSQPPSVISTIESEGFAIPLVFDDKGLERFESVVEELRVTGKAFSNPHEILPAILEEIAARIAVADEELVDFYALIGHEKPMRIAVPSFTQSALNSPLPSTKSLSGATMVVCDWCEDQSRDVYCEECFMSLCRKCEQMIHEHNATKATHTRNAIQPNVIEEGDESKEAEENEEAVTGKPLQVNTEEEDESEPAATAAASSPAPLPFTKMPCDWCDELHEDMAWCESCFMTLCLAHCDAEVHDLPGRSQHLRQPIEDNLAQQLESQRRRRAQQQPQPALQQQTPRTAAAATPQTPSRSLKKQLSRSPSSSGAGVIPRTPVSRTTSLELPRSPTMVTQEGILVDTNQAPSTPLRQKQIVTLPSPSSSQPSALPSPLPDPAFVAFTQIAQNSSQAGGAVVDVTTQQQQQQHVYISVLTSEEKAVLDARTTVLSALTSPPIRSMFPFLTPNMTAANVYLSGRDLSDIVLAGGSLASALKLLNDLADRGETVNSFSELPERMWLAWSNESARVDLLSPRHRIFQTNKAKQQQAGDGKHKSSLSTDASKRSRKSSIIAGVAFATAESLAPTAAGSANPSRPSTAASSTGSVDTQTTDAAAAPVVSAADEAAEAERLREEARAIAAEWSAYENEKQSQLDAIEAQEAAAESARKHEEHERRLREERYILSGNPEAAAGRTNTTATNRTAGIEPTPVQPSTRAETPAVAQQQQTTNIIPSGVTSVVNEQDPFLSPIKFSTPLKQQQRSNEATTSTTTTTPPSYEKSLASPAFANVSHAGSGEAPLAASVVSASPSVESDTRQALIAASVSQIEGSVFPSASVSHSDGLIRLNFPVLMNRPYFSPSPSLLRKGLVKWDPFVDLVTWQKTCYTALDLQRIILLQSLKRRIDAKQRVRAIRQQRARAQAQKLANSF